MKKCYLFLLFVFFIMSGCSVQDKMNPDILIKRLSDKCESLIFYDAEYFSEKTDFVCYVKNKNNIEYVFEFSENELGDVNKISFSCNKTEKAENFIYNIKNVVSVYSPKENTDDIIKNLTLEGNLKKGMNYFENQWYLYCTNVNENGLFFSVTNKKLFPQTSVDYSLKPNDKYDF